MHSYRTVLCTSLSTAFVWILEHNFLKEQTSHSDTGTNPVLSKYPGLVTNCSRFISVDFLFSVTVPFSYLYPCFRRVCGFFEGCFGVFFIGRGTKRLGTVHAHLAHLGFGQRIRMVHVAPWNVYDVIFSPLFRQTCGIWVTWTKTRIDLNMSPSERGVQNRRCCCVLQTTQWALKMIRTLLSTIMHKRCTCVVPHFRVDTC